MAEYIEREAVLAAFGEEPYVWTDSEYEIQERLDWHRYKGIVEAQPAADVVPVRHGRWVAKPQMYRHPNARNYYCSECRYEPTETKMFCPLCGARMDGE